MNDDKKKLDLKALRRQLDVQLKRWQKYSFISFLTIVVLLYGFLLYRINSLGSSQPSDNAVSALVKATQTPHIDPKVVEQLNSLQDNSVSVKALFNQARDNPFQ